MTDRFGVPAWARFGVTAVVAAVVVAGCTGADPDPAPTTPAATATVSESPTQAPTVTSEPTEAAALPPLPDAAKENTPEGAEAFIRYYFDVVNALLMEPREGVLPGLSHPNCRSCESTEQQISDLASSAQRAKTTPYSIKSMARVGGSFDDVTTFNMEVTLPANAILDSAGEAVAESESALFIGEGAAKWEGDAWVLYGLNLQP